MLLKCPNLGKRQHGHCNFQLHQARSGIKGALGSNIVSFMPGACPPTLVFAFCKSAKSRVSSQARKKKEKPRKHMRPQGTWVECFCCQWHVWLRGPGFQGMGSINSPAHTQEDCVEGNLGTLKLFVKFIITMKDNTALLL
eukprot:1101718-Pelagomonas_calceolata.AAC.2